MTIRPMMADTNKVSCVCSFKVEIFFITESFKGFKITFRFFVRIGSYFEISISGYLLMLRYARFYIAAIRRTTRVGWDKLHRAGYQGH